jgi:pantoate--beta-alanine ligase
MLRIIKSLNQWQAEWREAKALGKTIGFVPTMGYLHRGHLSLVRRAARENDVVIVSIFVNPTQFGPREDFKSYPRNLKRDCALLRRGGADFFFLPSVRAVYPKGFSDWVEPGPLARGLCGRKRPGHFRGVATVVRRLFAMVRPDRAYFGKKDYQQARVIEWMTARFRLPVKIVLCPTVREKDGLAMSSRNVYLSREERLRACAIPRALGLGRRLVCKERVRNASRIKELLKSYLNRWVTSVDYVELVDTETLTPVRIAKGKLLIAVACFVGKARLIDNLEIQV